MLDLLTYTDDGTTVVPSQFSPSLSRLANDTGLGRSTVARHLDALESAGWVTREQPETAQAIRANQTTSYQLQAPQSQSGTSPAAGLRTRSQSGTAPSPRAGLPQTGHGTNPQVGGSPALGLVPQRDTTRTTTSRTSSRPSSSKRDYGEPLFAEFWSIFPKKVAKAKAYDEFRAAVKHGNDAADIIAGAKRYAAEREGHDPTYTKQPDGWLKAERWTDEPAQPVPPSAAANGSSNGQNPRGHVPWRDPEDQSAYLQGLFPDEQGVPHDQLRT